MGEFRTHYDNLQVARNASLIVIVAAYRSLSFKFHPDRNGGDPKCEEVMGILNRSYAVLSDPEKRAAYDIRIGIREGQTTRAAPSADKPAAQPKGGRDQNDSGGRLKPDGFQFRRLAWPVMIVGGIALISLLSTQEPKASGLAPYKNSLEAPATTAVQPITDATGNGPLPTDFTGSQGYPSSPPAYTRPATAPNGSEWPANAGYIKGYSRLQATGLSTVTVDNSSNSMDVYVKVVLIEENSTKPVRQIYIPAHDKFTLRKMNAGKYDVRYMDLGDGSLSRSESFDLQQIEEADGTRFSNITMTLFKVENGNMQTYPLLASEF
jgi:curved DNA-binding protein CbpA